jgi:2'-5' RNA ligase
MRIADHWWWRPGWRAGRRMYTWHVTFAGLPAVRDLAGRAQARLAGLPGLDLVPAEWLHLTMQDVGFTDEVARADVDAMVAAARRRMAGAEPPRVRIGPAHAVSEGVLLNVQPSQGLTDVRTRLRAAIASTWPAAVPGPEDWWPHISVAYSHVSGPADIYQHALANEHATVDVTIGAVQLIVLGRDEHVYEWAEYSRVSLRHDAAS